MYICYLDESGTEDPSGNTGHFVLLGLAIAASTWKSKDVQVLAIKQRYELGGAEIHTAWMVRDYPEQRHVPNFDALDSHLRRKAVLGVRALNLARSSGRTSSRELLRTYKKTEAYVHLSRQQRAACLRELAELVGSWGDIRLFADAHDKAHAKGTQRYDMAFEQTVTRFNTFLQKAGGDLGLLVQDNNQTVSRRLTNAMRAYHEKGTLWAAINNIVETPMFVDSALTSMVQLADLCAYSTRRYFDNGETTLFDLIRPRFDRNGGRLVGLRHFTGRHQCRCAVCIDHGR